MSGLTISRSASIADAPPAPGAPPTLSLAALTPRLGSKDMAVIRQIAPAGVDGPAHSHDRDEVMIMLEGSLSVEAGDTVASLSPGDAVLVPAGTTHQLKNAGSGDAQWLTVSRAGIRFFVPGGDEVPAPEWAQ